jgi:hypothetical protein
MACSSRCRSDADRSGASTPSQDVDGRLARVPTDLVRRNTAVHRITIGPAGHSRARLVHPRERTFRPAAVASEMGHELPPRVLSRLAKFGQQTMSWKQLCPTYSTRVTSRAAWRGVDRREARLAHAGHDTRTLQAYLGPTEH